MPAPGHSPTARSRSGTGPILTSAVLAAVGMSLALAATWPPAGPQPDAPGRRLVLDLPDWLTGAVALGVVALFLALVANALSAPRRPEAPTAPRLPPVAAALLAVAPLLAGAAAVGTWALWRPGRPPGDAAALAAPEVLPENAVRAALQVPAADIGVTLGLASASLAAIGVALWLLSQNEWSLPGLGGLRRRRQAAELTADLASAVAAGAADLSTGCDPRGAVIACYRRCEQTIARQHHPRRPWQTPREFVHGALAALALPERPVASLMDVFERARFGDRPVTPADRDAAVAALRVIRSALEDRNRHGSRH
jgi:Domain of unknown function (DUF4129)